METSINQRVVNFLRHLLETNKAKNKTDLAKKLDTTPQYIGNIMAGDRGPGKEFIDKIIKLYPSAANEIYLAGSFEMHDSPINYNKSLPVIPHDPEGKDIPVINTEVYAGIVQVLSGAMMLPPETFVRIPMFSGGEAAVQITGHSMKGYINHGDWVIIRRLTDQKSIMYGEPYLVVTKSDNVQTVKFIKPCDDEDDMLSLVPYNIEQFEPHNIYKEDILAMYRVIGSFRSH